MGYRICYKKSKDHLYAAIVEDFYNPVIKRGSIRNIKSYGDLNKRRLLEPDIDQIIQKDLARIKADGEKQRAISNKSLLDRAFEPNIADNTPGSVPALNYGIALYRKLWERLNLDTWFNQYCRNHKDKVHFDYDLAAFFLSACRILYPASRKRTFERRAGFVYDFSSLTLDNLYDTLGLLSTSKETLVKHLNKNIGSLYERTVTVALYDCTTFYFESFASDDLRARGMSKENRTNEVQVVMGLLIDGDGIPLDYDLFKGNTAEIKTLLQVIKRHREESGLGRVTVIADRGLNCAFNLAELAEEGFDYIVAQSIDRLNAGMKEQVFDENWEYVFGTEDNDTFKLKTIKDGKDSIVVSWSLKREQHDLKVLEERWEKSCELIDKGSAAVEAAFKHGIRQFLKSKKGHKAEYEPNTRLHEKRRQSAGYYALRASHQELPPDEIYAKLRQLWRVEECFRVLKSNLEARPVYVWSTEHIKGHFLICYLALVLERLSLKLVNDAGIEVSNHRLIELMRKQQVIVLPSAKRIYTGCVRTGLGDMQSVEQADKAMSYFNLEAVNRVELTPVLLKKLKVKLPFSLK